MCKNSIQIPQVHLDQNYPCVDFVNFQAPPGDAILPLPTKCVFMSFFFCHVFFQIQIYFKIKNIVFNNNNKKKRIN